MVRRLVVLVVLIVFGLQMGLQTVAADGAYVVQRGDTLIAVAQKYGVTVSQLAQANGLAWNSWVYVGQSLTIPGYTQSSTDSAINVNTTPGNSGSYIVKPNDTLASIARSYGSSVVAIQTANSINNPNFIYPGQRLTIPGGTGEPTVPIPAAAPSTPSTNAMGAGGEKWISVDLTNQTLTAYEGNTPVFNVVVSTGTYATPTVVGSYPIYVKYTAADMSGGYGANAYYLADVPYVMYFHGGYGIHGTYWHNNFGTPMSRGCVNLTIPDAEWLFNWAPLGTVVKTHY